MKGAPVKTLRSTVSAILDKVAALLQSEPARVIGYGAAVVVYLVVAGLNAMGITKLGSGLSFDAAIAITVSSLTFVGLVVEAIRKFVYSPLTYIEDLADENKAGHQAAHMEESLNQIISSAIAEAQPKTKQVAIGSVKAAGSKDQSN